MQSITGFLKKVIAPSDNDDTDSHPVNGAEIQTQTAESYKGDNSWDQDESDGGLSDDLRILKETVYDLIKDIRDPEKPETLEELNVVCEENVSVRQFNDSVYLVKVVFIPTVPHCSLASIIGLCMRQKLVQNLPEKHKLDIYIKKGTHETADEINKQINDKERIAAAMENPNLRDLVNKCIDEEETFR